VDPTKYLLGYLLVVLLAVSEAFPMSLSAMVGAALLVAFGVSDGIFSFSEALSFIDLELLALLVGVMIVVEVVDRCGTFRYLALKVVRRVLKRPVLLLVVAGLMSALTSLLLSDEAALLLIVAILLSLGKAGALDPVPFAVSSAIMVNLGGTGTLVGSVPNMAIGIRAGFSFAEFASYLLPCEFALYGVTLALLYLYYRGKLQSSGGEAELEEIEVSRVDVAKGSFPPLADARAPDRGRHRGLPGERGRPRVRSGRARPRGLRHAGGFPEAGLGHGVLHRRLHGDHRGPRAR